MAPRSPFNCTDCPRLVAHLQSVRERHAEYHAAPVPAWGKKSAPFLIVGLAPGMHGANRTGRPFTGDDSGKFLFAALARHGFATSPMADGARLTGVRITNAVKCLPPENKPNTGELKQCARHLRVEMAEMFGDRPRKPRLILTLGGLAHRSVANTLGSVFETSVHQFRHNGLTRLGPCRFVLSSYHPSRQNTNTGRLTVAMLDAVLVRARQVLDGCYPGE